MSQADIDIKTVVTARDSSVGHSVKATTPDSVEAHVNLVAMPWWKIVAIRAARTYLTALSGFMSAGGAGLDMGLMPNEWIPLFYASLQMAIAPAVMSVLLNSTELLTKLDTLLPEIRA